MNGYLNELYQLLMTAMYVIYRSHDNKLLVNAYKFSSLNYITTKTYNKNSQVHHSYYKIYFSLAMQFDNDGLITNVLAT